MKQIRLVFFLFSNQKEKILVGLTQKFPLPASPPNAFMLMQKQKVEA